MTSDASRTQADSEPSFSEQIADQLGGVRGMVESSVPIGAFVLVNIVWSLNPAIIVAVALAVAIGVFRLARRQTARHAMNGLFGIAIGAILAWRTGNAKDFYLPGILFSLGYAAAMVASVAMRRPLVGWIWSIVADRGGTRWRDDGGLRRTFGWLTLVWALIYLIKVVANAWVYYAGGLSEDEKASILGIMRIVLGPPPYLLLVALTIWAVRRYLRAAEQNQPPPIPA